MRTITTDVVVVGAGVAGLAAAAACREAGREVVLVESTDRVGGSTAADTGQFWLPATGVGKSADDSPEQALEYLDALLGPVSPSSSAERREAFVQTSADVARWLATAGVTLAPVRGSIDFHPELHSSSRGGRALASTPFDRRTLGPLSELLRETDYQLEIAPRSARGVVVAAQTMALRLVNPTKDLVTGGAALAGHLLRRITQLGVTLWMSSEMVDLLDESGMIAGVVVKRQGQDIELRANDGVILACGGFEANPEMRREHLPLPTDVEWSSGLPSNTGAGIRSAQRVGAGTAEMDEAWWTIVARFNGRTYRMTSERSAPHGIIVDRAGDRYFDEAGPSPVVGREPYARSRRVRAIPSYLIVDNRHRQRYRMGPWLPGSSPAADNDALLRARTLPDLAEALKIDEAGLLGTVVRFNGFAAKGTDADFDRGKSIADRVHGDPLYRKNPCLGTLEKSPYWAVPVYPGDSGTKGGVLVDVDSRVCTSDGAPIPRLYATAGTAATLFQDTAPGVGAALASSLVDAYRAAMHLTSAKRSS